MGLNKKIDNISLFIYLNEQRFSLSSSHRRRNNRLRILRNRSRY